MVNFPTSIGNVHFRNGPNRGNVEFSNSSMVNTSGHEVIFDITLKNCKNLIFRFFCRMVKQNLASKT